MQEKIEFATFPPILKLSSSPNPKDELESRGPVGCWEVGMKQILVLGAGRSAPFLIKYLLDNAEEHDWFVTVGDLSLEAAERAVASGRLTTEQMRTLMQHYESALRSYTYLTE